MAASSSQFVDWRPDVSVPSPLYMKPELMPSSPEDSDFCVLCVCVCVLFLYTLLEIQPTLFLCYLQHGFFSFFCMKMFKKRLFFALNRRQSASNQTIIAVPVRPLKKRTLAEKSWKMRLMQLEIILQCPKHTAEWRLLWVIWYSSNY